MSGKATVRAGANIAFIKYWGARDLERAIPFNPSISMTLTRCYSRSTVEHLDQDGTDEVLLRAADGSLADPGRAFAQPIHRQLERVRRTAGRGGSFRVATENSFPSAAGMASSASGFAALTAAAALALGLDLDDRELSSLTRLSGSGSAARSTLGGFVEWPAGTTDEACHAVCLAEPSHWDLRNVVAIVETGPKPVSSREGHRRAATSPYFEQRQRQLPARLEQVREAIRERDLARLGPVIEEDAVDLHLIAMSSRPPIFYWKPATLRVLEAVRKMRDQGLSVWATMDAGPNVHVICTHEEEDEVVRLLDADLGVKTIIRDRVGPGPQPTGEHLF